LSANETQSSPTTCSTPFSTDLNNPLPHFNQAFQ